MLKQNRIVLAIAGAVFLAIVALEMAAPANVVGAYGFVLPILLVATVRSRSLMIVTVLGLYRGDLYGADATDQTGSVSIGGDQSECGGRSTPDRGLYRYDLGGAQDERSGRARRSRPGDGKSFEGQYAAGRGERPAESLGTFSCGGATGGVRRASRSERRCTRLPGMCKRWLKSRASRLR